MNDKDKRKINFEFLNTPNFLDETTREIDEDQLVTRIRSINPQMTVMVICYSQYLELKWILEKHGLFAEMRMNRDLSIVSNGQILTMNQIQKDFIHAITKKENVEKDVVVTGPVGSGKTLLGLEAINIKKSHYKKKYGISPSDCQHKLRVLIWIGWSNQDMLKQQLLNDMPKTSQDCSMEIHCESDPNSQKLESIFQANENCKAFLHTIIMFDEIWR